MAQPVMTGRIVVLGGAGQLGRAAAQAFQAAGWQVASLVRGSSAAGAAAGTEIIEVDARDAGSMIAAATGADVVLHALNVPYTEWGQFALPFVETAIAAVQAHGDAELIEALNVTGLGSHAFDDLPDPTLSPVDGAGHALVLHGLRELDAAQLSSACDVLKL